MLTKEALQAIVDEQEGEYRRARERVDHAQAVLNEARSELARADGALGMAKHLASEAALAERKIAEQAAAALLGAGTSADASAGPAEIIAQSSSSSEPAAFISR